MRSIEETGAVPSLVRGSVSLLMQLMMEISLQEASSQG